MPGYFRDQYGRVFYDTGVGALPPYQVQYQVPVQAVPALGQQSTLDPYALLKLAGVLGAAFLAMKVMTNIPQTYYTIQYTLRDGEVVHHGGHLDTVGQATKVVDELLSSSVGDKYSKIEILKRTLKKSGEHTEKVVKTWP